MAFSFNLGTRIKNTTGGGAPVSLLFDDVSNGIAGYAMDKMAIGYAGNAVRIRRDSDNAEQDIGYVGNLFDSADASSFIGGGNGFGATMYDNIGVNDIVQATAGAQPQLISDLLRGDGANDYLRGTPPAVAGDFTVAMWMKSATVNSTNIQPFGIGLGGLTDNLVFQFNRATSALRTYWNSSGGNLIDTGSQGDFTDTVWYHFMVVRSGTTIEVFVDNVSVGSSTTNTSFTMGARLTLFANHTAGGNGNVDMDIFGYWNRAVTSGERAIIRGFNAKK